MTFKEVVLSDNKYSYQIYSKDLEEFVLNHKYFNTSVIEYLNDFTKTYNISFENINKDLIILTFFKSALILHKHVASNTNWAESSIYEYINTVRRILEFLLYIHHINIEEINKIYLNDKISEFDHYYFFLKYLSINKINKNFKIISGKNSQLNLDRNFVALSNLDNTLSKQIDSRYVYHPIGKHILTGPVDDIEHLEFYFKTNNEKNNVVFRIFSLDEPQERIYSKLKNNSRRKALCLEVFEIINYIQLPMQEVKELSEETKKEEKLQSTKEVISPILDHKVAKLINKNFSDALKENSIESNYKRFLINKAVSNSYIRKNISLRTVYNKPSLPIFRDFLNYLQNSWNENFFIDIIIFSTILGISVEKIIYSILNLDETFNYKKVHKKISKLQIKVNKNSFADFFNLIENNLSHKIKKEGEINLIPAFEEKWLNIKGNLCAYLAKKLDIKNIIKFAEINNDINLNEDIIKKYVEKYKELVNLDDIKKYMQYNFTKRDIQNINNLRIEEYYITNFLKENMIIYAKHLKAYPKNTKISLGMIHTLFYYYYQIYNPENDIQLLFTQRISTNDETRLTYCNTLKRLLVYEKWIYSLAKHLNLDDYFMNEVNNYKLTEIDYESRIGSTGYIKAYEFNNFLNSLNRLKVNDEITKVNIFMIFIRYVFSISLVSRDIKKSSSNLSNLSKRFKIITIQEKRKNLYQGKRIIALTNLAIDCINVFNQLKIKYNISDTSPVLLFKENKLKEVPVTQSNVKKYFLNLEKIEKDPYNKKIIEDILKFVLYTPLNFGRHIVTSKMVQKGVSSEYIDAIMNHYKLGKEDQGKYSNFNTLEYVNFTRQILEDIEEEYIPISERGIVYDY